MSARAEGLRLDELLRALPGGSALEGDGSARVSGVHQDSRRVEAGDLFVARRGQRADGAAFVQAALARGAAAVLTDALTEVPAGVPVVRVEDVRLSLAVAAAAVYGHPARHLCLVGITGTNGKTTTAHLVRAALDGAAGRPACGIVGTVGHSFGSYRCTAANTTPEADELHRVLAAMRDLGATHVAMEVSSIALACNRVEGLDFRVAAFTNLTQDHLDYHGTMEAYAAAKEAMFRRGAARAAVIHVGDPFGRALAARAPIPCVRVTADPGASAAEAEISPVRRALSVRGIEATVRVPGGEVELASPLVGAHNLENLVVALGVVVALGLDVSLAACALRGELGAPGRLERCEAHADDVVVLVDYAHTPDALERVLASVRTLARGRVLAVMGCGGDRDSGKRGPMGAAAARGSDVVIVTNDNPRHEVPEQIAQAIVAGVRGAGAQELRLSDLAAASRGYAVELDRARAIEAAIAAAAPGDTVVICGKGHEDYQVYGDERLPFDDRVEARAALARRRAGAPVHDRGAV